MVKIQKREKMLTVPMSAYTSLYKANGWVIVDGSENQPSKIKTQKATATANPVADLKSVVDFSSMSTAEMKEYAKINNIDISEATSKKSLRSILETEVNM